MTHKFCRLWHNNQSLTKCLVYVRLLLGFNLLEGTFEKSNYLEFLAMMRLTEVFRMRLNCHWKQVALKQDLSYRVISF